MYLGDDEAGLLESLGKAFLRYWTWIILLSPTEDSGDPAKLALGWLLEQNPARTGSRVKLDPPTIFFQGRIVYCPIFFNLLGLFFFWIKSYVLVAYHEKIHQYADLHL